MRSKENDWEVIVLGNGLGGLIAATLLAKKKRRVLVLKEKDYLESYEKDGYRFVPFSNLFERRVRLGLLHRIAQGLGISLLSNRRNGTSPSRRNGEKKKIGLQVILPGARIDLFSNRSLLETELKREFPREFPRLIDFYEELEQARVLLEQQKTHDRTREYYPLRRPTWSDRFLSVMRVWKEKDDAPLGSFSREFQQFVRLQVLARANVCPDRLPLGLLAYLLTTDEQAEGFGNGVALGLREKIKERFLQLQGRIEEVETVHKAHLEGRRVLTLSLDRGQRVFNSEFVVINAPLDHFEAPSGRWQKPLAKWKEKLQPRYVLVPFFIGIKDRAVPVGMRDLVVSIRDVESSYLGGNLLFLSLSRRGDESEAPEGRRALTVQSVMPLGEFDEEALAEQKKAVMEHIQWLFPFSENLVEWVDMEWAKSHLYRWSYCHYLYEPLSNRDWREEAIPLRLGKGLYFTGKGNFPFLGVEGEVLSGFLVAEQILKHYPEPTPGP